MLYIVTPEKAVDSPLCDASKGVEFSGKVRLHTKTHEVVTLLFNDSQAKAIGKGFAVIPATTYIEMYHHLIINFEFV